MEPRARPRPARRWRERLAGRVAFDVSAAEATIRRAYRLAGLEDPADIIWVDGPRQAAQAAAFLGTPPRRLRRGAYAGMAAGLLFWAALAFQTTGGLISTRTPAGAAVAAIMLAGFAVYLGGYRQLPVLPALCGPQHDRRSRLLAAALFLLLAGLTFALLTGGAIASPAGRAGAVMFAAAGGALPGLYLLWRIERLYSDLPPHLHRAGPSRSVAERLLRMRRQVWAPQRAGAARLRHADAILRACDMAFDDAFASRAGRSLQRLGAEIVGTDLDPAPPDRFAPPHLDGIGDSPRAAAAEGEAGSGAAAFADLAYHVDRLFPFDRAAIAVRPPLRQLFDADDRLHGEAGAALEWADGTRIHAWHGRVVPAHVFTRAVTLERIERENDADLRWVMIERYGLGRYLQESGAQEVQRDECGQLYRLPQRISETIYAVRVVNHTPEPDGSFREYWLAVPPTVATARQAVAWTFGLTAEEYRPVAQS